MMMVAAVLLLLLSPALLVGLAASATPYDEYILAPSSRTVYPASIYRTNGTVSNAEALLSGNGTHGSAVLTGNASVTLDYGRNIGGVVSVTVGAVAAPAVLAVTFSESSLWVSGAASDATSDAGLDAPLWLAVDGPGTYTVAREFDRGAFRYLSVVSNASAAVEVRAVAVRFTAAPAQRDLRAYTGYFHCDDELLNRIWYAGAYTCQLCSIDPTHGDSLVWIDVINSSTVVDHTVPWYNNHTIAGGKTVLVDGAKRDRLVWPGDMVVAAPTIFVSTNDMDSIRNALDSLLALQQPSGALPYAGSPFQEERGFPFSFTYHLYSLLDIALYHEYTGDLGYLQSVWRNFTLALEYSLGFVDETGLMNVTSSHDWLRVGMGGHNIEANAILYHTLREGTKLAGVLHDTSSAARWPAVAAGIKSAANALLWDEAASLFRDNETTGLHPQDGNAWAVLANLTPGGPAQARAVSAALRARWGPYGAPAPEAGSAPATVSPFAAGLELLAHHAAGDAGAAHGLARLQWGYMLDGPGMTNSTLVEGYAADGSLRYAPYPSDARVSHAHGWSTGPTAALTFHTAGLRPGGGGGGPGGWVVAPRLGGGVGAVAAGLEAPAGRFAVEARAADGAPGVVAALWFETPAGTVGDVSLPGTAGHLRGDGGRVVALVGGEASGVPGGSWTLVAEAS